jgi:predicted CoA-binding protein
MSTSMTFKNANRAKIAALLKAARTIAVIGLSANPARPSFEVASALLNFGYRVIPVNPKLDFWEGIRAFPTLEAAVRALAPETVIDIVNVFRQPKHVATIVDDCIRVRIPAIWLQLGVIDESSAMRAQEAGLTVVMDKCIKVERMRS